MNMTSSVEITGDLMQHVLREAEKDSTIAVLPSLTVDNNLTQEMHWGSCITRVTVRYTRGDDKSEHTLSLIVKFVSNFTEFAESDIFVREIQMYDQILPRISARLSKVLSDRHINFIPQGYYTQKIPTYIVALEDLAPKGFIAPKRMAGLDLKQSLLALRAIARFHAASVVIRNEDESLFTVFDKHVLHGESMRQKLMMMSSHLMLGLSTMLESLPEIGATWANRVRNRSQTMVEDMMNLTTRDDDAFNVLIHGDFGCHNVMYRHSESSGEAEEVMLIDFQLCCYNSPALDLHQFIFTNVNGEVQVNHLDTLLREYHAELTATLESLGAPQEQTISFTDLQQEFNKKMLHGFFCTIVTVPFASLETNSTLGPEEFFGLLSNDIGKLQSLLSDSYVKTLKSLLNIFGKHNVI